jgi:shikimate kinase
LRENGTVLYLHAEPETLWQRLRNSRQRPMLHGNDPRNRLVELYQLRDPLYREVADHVIESDREAVIRFVRWLDAEPCDGSVA